MLLILSFPVFGVLMLWCPTVLWTIRPLDINIRRMKEEEEEEVVVVVAMMMWKRKISNVL